MMIFSPAEAGPASRRGGTPPSRIYPGVGPGGGCAVWACDDRAQGRARRCRRAPTSDPPSQVGHADAGATGHVGPRIGLDYAADAGSGAADVAWRVMVRRGGGASGRARRRNAPGAQPGPTGPPPLRPEPEANPVAFPVLPADHAEVGPEPEPLRVGLADPVAAAEQPVAPTRPWRHRGPRRGPRRCPSRKRRPQPPRWKLKLPPHAAPDPPTPTRSRLTRSDGGRGRGV